MVVCVCVRVCRPLLVHGTLMGFLPTGTDGPFRQVFSGARPPAVRRRALGAAPSSGLGCACARSCLKGLISGHLAAPRGGPNAHGHTHISSLQMPNFASSFANRHCKRASGTRAQRGAISSQVRLTEASARQSARSDFFSSSWASSVAACCSAASRLVGVLGEFSQTQALRCALQALRQLRRRLAHPVPAAARSPACSYTLRLHASIRLKQRRQPGSPVVIVL